MTSKQLFLDNEKVFQLFSLSFPYWHVVEKFVLLKQHIKKTVQETARLKEPSTRL